MNVTVLVPSSLRAALDGKRRVELGVPAGSGVGEVLQTLLTLYPKLARVLASERQHGKQGLTLFYEEAGTRKGRREHARVWLFAPGAEPAS
ncbi:MAG: MoaD/ThiS family protein [Myxococcaceae bacterium]